MKEEFMPRLNMGKIARGLKAVRRGRVRSAGGYFGAMQLAADIQARFRIPNGGGRPTDPNWTERRLVAVSRATLSKLQALAGRRNSAVKADPMQVAAVLLERAVKEI